MRTAYTITVTVDTDDPAPRRMVEITADCLAEALDRQDLKAAVTVEKERHVGPFWTSRLVTHYDVLPA